MEDYIGYIKLHRKIFDWEWYNDSQMIHLFIHLLLKANHKDKTWRGQSIKRGQILTGRKKLSMETGISEQSIRTCLRKLETSKEITSSPTNKHTIITICKYDSYQVAANNDQPAEQPTTNQELTSNQPATNQQLTTTNNDKNNKNDNNDKNNIIISDLKKIKSDDEVKSEKEKKKKTKGPSNPYHKHMKSIFMDHYEKDKGISYYWNVKDSVGLNQLTKKIEFTLREGGKVVGEEAILSAFKFILEHNPDKWVEENLSPAILNSKYNEIIQKIKSGRSKQSPNEDGKQGLRNYREQILRRMGSEGVAAFGG